MGRGRRRLARAIQRTAYGLLRITPALLSPEDLARLTRDAYDRGRGYGGLAGAGGEGLEPEEAALLEGVAPGPALCVGCGAGRELVALARRGFEPAGLDSSTGQVDRARRRLAPEHPDIPVRVLGAEGLGVPRGSQALICLLGAVYAHVAPRRRRIALLAEVRELLRPRGAVVLDAYLDPRAHQGRGSSLLALTARVIGGNRELEPGDVLLDDLFLHRHRDLADLEGEVAAGGLHIDRLDVGAHRVWLRLRAGSPDP